MESEIFGHEKGAFTGAVERRAGCFELAEEGTLLLDELGEMPIGTQAKLLRVLEERKLRRLGARNEQDVDVRVLAATNRNPEEAVADGKLRSDLFYRLNVFHIHLPPLREHTDDIPDMVEAMIADMNLKHGRRVNGVSPAVMERLKQHDWPGNARELRNLTERAVILANDGGQIEVAQLPPTFGRVHASVAVAAGDANSVTVRVGSTVDEAERLLILRTLEFTGQNKTRAAEMLGVSLKTLHNKLKEYEASREMGSHGREGGGVRE
jgi:transcriptional regulator with PAS, ATPase and Fis domain